MRKHVVYVPQVMQMEAEECGAACLDMVCWYYKKWLPLEQVRLDCGVSRDGSSALSLVKTARRYGFETKSISCDIDYLRESVSFPAILHWEFNHFVVLAGFVGNKVVLNDPSKGRVEISLEDFRKAFTGVCLELQPSESFKPEGKRPTVSSFLKSRLASMKLSFAFVILSTILAGVSSVLLPLLYRFFLDKVLPEGMRMFPPYLVTFCALFAFQMVASLLDEAALHAFRGKLTVISDVEFMWHSLCLPLEFFSQRYSVDIAQRQSESGNVSDTIANKVIPLFGNLALSVVYLVLMLKTNSTLALVALIATGLNLLSSRITVSFRTNYANTMTTEQSKLMSTTVSGIDIIDTLKASGAENGFFARWAGLQGNQTRIETNFLQRHIFANAVPQLVHRLTSIVILALGAHLLIEGEFTIGMLMAFQSFLNQFMLPMETLMADSQELEEMSTSVQRISDVLDYPTDVLLNESNDSAPLTMLSGSIEVKDVVFGYSTIQPPVVNSLDLSIAKGAQVAIVGPTGSGKSTLVKLILGLYQPWRGEILFDGKLRSMYSHEVLTSSIAVVDQDIKVFQGTLMDNLKMWDSTIDDSVVINACRDAMIHNEVMLRTGGYGCLMAEGGKNFSGGQLQRFEIARVLSLNPSIIVLDEATSAMDARTEHQVMENIRRRGVTVLVVSHRLSAIRDSDEIVVVDQGKIVERGKHEQLFSAGGLYSRLVTLE